MIRRVTFECALIGDAGHDAVVAHRLARAGVSWLVTTSINLALFSGRFVQAYVLRVFCAGRGAEQKEQHDHEERANYG